LYEGFGIALVEAMKAGTPVIAHNGSCYPEVLQDAGILVDGLNPKEVGLTMYKMYTEESLRKNLIQKGLERSKSFSWDITAEETLKVFKSVL
jgi:glycosyltransferase involved in cell wall biosynthesis